MKKQTLIGIITAISLVFVIINLTIILSSDRIERSKALHSYSNVENGDLKKLLSTKGVVIPSSNYFIKYNKSLGAINEVLVTEGDAVLAGDILFDYQTGHIDAEIEELEQQISRLTARISSAESELSSLEQQLSDAQFDSSADSFDTDPFAADTTKQNDNSEEIISNQIGDKQDQIEDLNLQKDGVNQKIAQLQGEKAKYTVTSKMDGTVTEINPYAQTENDAVVSINSNQPFLIEGKLSEKHAVKVKEGQKVIAAAEVLPELKKEGTVKELKMEPIGVPSVDEKESFYPFKAELIEAAETWHHGYHVNLDIVLEERNGVVVIPDSAIQKKAGKTYVYVIKNGRLEKREINLGLEVNNRNEVLQGVAQGERIVRFPSGNLRDKMEIFMPIHHRYVEEKTLKAFTGEQIIRLLLRGIVHK
ncbi:efflux RND transporter periplasmic adaptor subunit [Peribacillus frigoritolerans]|uniref:efflux RND transporter periplasmic adaptor subunit n=1 Tax=Peribacillus frigoritolerans TaxID=450367 RepID=UPI001059BB95|nr:HlyD family efflux transporter periplasmic adaptor subunit [Peribacillus frigoritolerans]TDL82755.1 HlyD family efflux transporter periplasmic adaptor subunit [Peribacillus frigoritolerans]